MALPDTVIIEAQQYSHGNLTPVQVPVIAEYPVTLNLNGSPFVSIACLGSDPELLALGHLLAEGIVKSPEEIEQIDVDEKNLNIDVRTAQNDELLERLFRVHTITSGCGQGRAGLPRQ